MSRPDLLRVTDAGLYCDAGGFYADPLLPEDRAVVTRESAAPGPTLLDALDPSDRA